MSVRIEITTDQAFLDKDVQWLRTAFGVQKLEQSSDDPRRLVLEVYGDPTDGAGIASRFENFIREELRPQCGLVVLTKDGVVPSDRKEFARSVIGMADDGRPHPGRVTATILNDE